MGNFDNYAYARLALVEGDREDVAWYLSDFMKEIEYGKQSTGNFCKYNIKDYTQYSRAPGMTELCREIVKDAKRMEKELRSKEKD